MINCENSSKKVEAQERIYSKPLSEKRYLHSGSWRKNKSIAGGILMAIGFITIMVGTMIAVMDSRKGRMQKSGGRAV